jgi:hypothetical protein
MAEAPWAKYQTSEERESAGPWDKFAAPAPSAERQPILDRMNSGIGGAEAFAIGAGRGLTTLGRAVGMAEPEPEVVTRAYQGLQAQRPYSTGAGEIVGQAAPFIVPGVGVSAIPTTGARIGASAALGAIEGGLITKGMGGDAAEITGGAGVGGLVAGSLEAAFPVLSRFGGALVRRVTGSNPRGPLFDGSGNPTPELSESLNKLGINPADLGPDSTFALERQPAGVNTDQAARAARFQEIGIPATRGNITQDFGQQAAEERLASMAGGAAGEPVRATQLQQSEAFQSGINNLVESLGVPSDVGASLKDALSGRLQNLTGQKNRLYKEFAESARNVSSMPVFTDSIGSALPTKAELRRISRLPGNSVEALDELLVEFGVNQSPEAAEAFVKSGGEITPLSLGNFEDFRQALNQMADTQTPGGRATGNIVGKLKGALDEEVGRLEEALLASNPANSSMLEPLREARALVSRIKTEFSHQSISGRLIAAKPDGVTPIIEASKAYDSIMGRQQPIEYLERTLASLNEGGAGGKAAIGALQAETVLRALDKALQAPSRKTSGIQTVGYAQFVKALDSVGEDRLALLFADNSRALARLRMFQGAASDLTPDNRAVPKGSAPVILDIVNRLGRTPGIAAVVDGLKFIANAGADERAVRRAMNGRPQIKRVVGQIQNDYPSLASALGIAGINLEREDK